MAAPKGHSGYVCPSVVTHDGIVYADRRRRHLAGHQVRRPRRRHRHRTSCGAEIKGSNASLADLSRRATSTGPARAAASCHCQDAATGKRSTERRLTPDAGRIWASPVLADGKLYFVSQFKGVYVVAADPKLDLLAHNVFADDAARSNASLAISEGQLFLRNDAYLYCIGKRVTLARTRKRRWTSCDSRSKSCGSRNE